MEDLIFNKELLDIKKLNELIYEAYNVSIVAEYFCENFPEIEEIANITPIVKILHNKLDLAYATILDTVPEVSIDD